MVLFSGLFWVRLAFRFLIHSVCCQNLFISIKTCRERKWIFKPVSMYTIISWRSPIWYFFVTVPLRESRFIFTDVPSSSPSNSFPMLRIHSAFLLCDLRCHILLQNFVSLSSGWWYVLMHYPTRFWWNFCCCFGMFCFVCIIWSGLHNVLVFFLFLVPSGSFSRFPLFASLLQLCFFFSSQHVLVFFLYLIFFLLFVVDF